MNLPNTVTLCRLILIPLFLALWWGQYYFSAALVFAIASLTDLLDGYLARSLKSETKLGALLDPLVDKVLITAGLILLVEIKIIPGWAVVIILAREFLVTGLRTILVDKGIVLSAGKSGKLKTFLQSLSLILIYLGLSLRYHYDVHSEDAVTVGLVIFWLAFVVTILSGIEYAVKGKVLLEPGEDKKKEEILPRTNPSTDLIIEESTIV